MQTLQFLKVTALVELAIFVVIAPFLGINESGTLTILMVLPSMWLSRLILAWKSGQITKRLKGKASLVIWNPKILCRDKNTWRFNSYMLKEGAVCLLLWALMVGNMILPRIIERLS